jgi:rare lipoprotein A (peptidoglycan hydrolase)
MLLNKTVSSIIASVILLAPVSAQAISHSNFVDLGISDKPTIPRKWKTFVEEKGPSLASVYHGTASWYGPGFYGNATACGQTYRPGTFTVAHRHLPCGTRVRITNLNNGRSANGTVNDRGPYVGGRIVDLGHGIASYLGVTSSGLADVRLEVLD